MDDLKNVSPLLFTASATLAGFLLIDDMTANEQNAISGWFLLLGQILQTNAAQQILIENRATAGEININSKIDKSIYNPLFYDIDKLREVVANTTPNHTEYTLHLLRKTVKNLEKEIKELSNELEKK